MTSVVDVSYEDLNEILCKSMFTKEQAHSPAYIEIPDVVRSALADEFDTTIELVEPLILSITKEHLERSGTRNNPFTGAYKNIAKWRREILAGNIENFPELPLLLVFTFAAIEMGGEGDYNPNAYYPRLQKLLNFSDKDVIADSYRTHSSFIWENYNFWLDVAKKGQFGIGTAYSIGAHRHVGFVLSQALIRSGDRKKLPRLFRKNGFSAFASMVEHDMESIIEEWVTAEDHQFGSYQVPSKPFKNLWNKEDARLRISAIVCRELESWDGSVPKVQREDGHYEDDDEIQVRLEATRASFPAPALNISFAVSGFTIGADKFINVVARDGSRHAIALSTDPSGWFRPDIARIPIADEDLLENGLSVEYGPKLSAVRVPRKVVVLTLDDLTGRYRETERIEIGVRALVLVQDYRDTTDNVEKILENSARLNWKRIQSSGLKGLPANWTLFSDVELLQPPSADLLSHANLESLNPVRSGTLTFSSGLQLPGRPPKWHGAAGLEIRATVVGSSKLTIEISQILDGEVSSVVKTDYSQQTIIHKIEPWQLADGDYKVEIFNDDQEDVVARKTLLIRSSDMPDLETWKHSERLVYDLGLSAEAALNASPVGSDEIFVIDGALPVYEIDRIGTPPIRVPFSTEWWGSKTAIIDTKIQNFQLTSTSSFPCFEKGNHYMEYPAALPNRSGTGFQINETGKIEGRCRDCGLTRRSPADPYVLQRLFDRRIDQRPPVARDITLPRVDLKSLPPVDTHSVSWDLALDGLMHLGGGSEGYISTVSSNVDPSALFRHEFIRTLEMLAYLDISRDTEHQVKEWEVNPSFVVQTKSDFFLTGYWPTQYWNSLVEYFGTSKVYDQALENSFSRLTLKGVKVNQIESALLTLDIDATIALEPSLDMLKMLPNIKLVSEQLPSCPYGIFDEICLYDPDQNSWIPISGSKLPKIGGYRLTSAYRNQYAVVVSQDLEQGRLRYSSSEFAKFFCSSVTLKKPLFSYHAEKKQLIVPKGAPLPGMYGRAAVMASGYMPRLDTSKRYLVYEAIEKDFAEILAAKLGGQ